MQNVFGTPPWEQSEQRQPQRQPTWRRNKQTGIVELWQNGQWIARAAGAGISPVVRQGITRDMQQAAEQPEGPGILKRAAAAGLSGLDTALNVLDIPMKPVHWAKERAVEQMMRVPALSQAQTVPLEGMYPEIMAGRTTPTGQEVTAPPLARTIGEVAELPLYGPVYRGVVKGIGLLRGLPGVRGIPGLGRGVPTPTEQAAGMVDATESQVGQRLDEAFGTGAKVRVGKIVQPPVERPPRERIVYPPTQVQPLPLTPKPTQVGLAQPGVGQVQPSPPPPVTVKTAARIKSVGDPKATRTQAAIDKVDDATLTARRAQAKQGRERTEAGVKEVRAHQAALGLSTVGKRGALTRSPSVVGDWWDRLTPMERTNMFKQEYGQTVPAGYKGMPFDLLLADYKSEIAALHAKYGKRAKPEDIDKALKSMEKPPEVRRRRPPKTAEVD